MQGRKGKRVIPFIVKKREGESFVLMHRSQQDPLYYDDNGEAPPQREGNDAGQQAAPERLQGVPIGFHS